MTTTTLFPSETVTLRDNATVQLRSLQPADQDRILACFYRLSSQTIFYRALEYRTTLTADEARQLCDVDGVNRVAIAAVRSTPKGEDIIGVARYALCEPDNPEVAEAAIVVEDAFQRRGLGTILLSRLVEHARTHGVRCFRAAVHGNNAQILRFIERSGLLVERHQDQGLWEFLVHLDPADTVPLSLA